MGFIFSRKGTILFTILFFPLILLFKLLGYNKKKVSKEVNYIRAKGTINGYAKRAMRGQDGEGE